MNNPEDNFIDCEPIGECISVDSDGNKFYVGVNVNGIDVRRFDCVRVVLEVSSACLYINDARSPIPNACKSSFYCIRREIALGSRLPMVRCWLFTMMATIKE